MTMLIPILSKFTYPNTNNRCRLISKCTRFRVYLNSMTSHTPKCIITNKTNWPSKHSHNFHNTMAPLFSLMINTLLCSSSIYLIIRIRIHINSTISTVFILKCSTQWSLDLILLNNSLIKDKMLLSRCRITLNNPLTIV